MEGSVRPTSSQFREAYDAAFRAWANLHLRAAKVHLLPASCLFTREAFRQHPYFPQILRLNSVPPGQHGGPRRLYATGCSTWGSPPCKDGDCFPPFQQRLEIDVAFSSPTTLSIADSIEEGPGKPPLFVRSDANYIPVLILAWAYILSARWAELLGEGCIMSYTDIQAQHQHSLREQSPDQTTSYVDIGDVSAEETRWWAAILATGQGWQASLPGGQHLSPWSVYMQGCRFMVLGAAESSPSVSFHGSAVPCSTAVGFLDRFCLRHNIMDQSHVALGAVLLFPCFGIGRALRLPYPKLKSAARLTNVSASQYGLASEPHHNWVNDEHHLERLLTLSCRIKGIRPMLLSVFYDPSVDCNLATPWLQGTVAAIDSISQEDPFILARMFMEREPSVAFLWAGATILKLQEPLLQEIRRGQIQADFYSAVWSGTLQAFIQQPVSRPLVVDGCVSRADEARLLFLSQSGRHARVPICQWRPFGVTPVEDVDLEVRIHEKCEDHWLRYQGFCWDCVDGESQFQPAGPATECRPAAQHSYVKGVDGERQVTIIRHGLDSEKDHVSENATRNIFDWLRYDGWPRSEKDIRGHEWFDLSDSEDEKVEVVDEAKSPSPKVKDTMSIEAWLSTLNDEVVTSKDN